MSAPTKKLPGVNDLTPGGIIPTGGTANEYVTGGWRSKKPIWKPEACVHCLTCWILCPDTAINAAKGKITGYNYNHCKGCGICVHECPINKQAKAGKAKNGPAIEFVDEIQEAVK